VSREWRMGSMGAWGAWRAAWEALLRQARLDPASLVLQPASQPLASLVLHHARHGQAARHACCRACAWACCDLLLWAGRHADGARHAASAAALTSASPRAWIAHAMWRPSTTREQPRRWWRGPEISTGAEIHTAGFLKERAAFPSFRCWRHSHFEVWESFFLIWLLHRFTGHCPRRPIQQTNPEIK
jgi:hypothetical protein